MKMKRIVQYCCAALVLAGMGLNIQNALAGYGIGENSHSLVATDGTGSASCLESISLVSFSCSGLEDVTGTVMRCGSKAGKWTVKGVKPKNGKSWLDLGLDFIVPGTGVIWQKWCSQLTHYYYETIPSHTGEYQIIDGRSKEKIAMVKYCVETDGEGDSCTPKHSYIDDYKYE